MFMLLLFLLSALVATSVGFQVAPDPNKRFKHAIDKLSKSTSKFTIADDLRFPNTISSEVLGARPLTESIYMQNFVQPTKTIPRKLFGHDEYPTEYWFHNEIHTFGNTNVFGGLHAACAPMATRLIDELAYDGLNVRYKIAVDLRQAVNKTNAYILDLCCGVGMSTRALASSFEDADFICGIDTSPEMIAMARYITKNNAAFKAIESLFSGPELVNAFLKLIMDVSGGVNVYPNCMYAIGNAERVKSQERKFDLVTIMYAFHEIPKSARSRILREARRLLTPGGTLAIVDIDPKNYSPSPSMLAGEPYVLEYQQNVQRQIERFKGFHNLETKAVVPGLLTMWTLTRNDRTLTKKDELLTGRAIKTFS